jgi:hypothetical protein
MSGMMRLVLVLGLLAAAAQAQMPLTITTSELPRGVTQFIYYTPLHAAGGTPPYRWTLDGGSLPAGLEIDGGGFLSGTPMATGDFRLLVRVSDSARMPQIQVREFLLHVVPPIVAEWKTAPRVQGNAINGSVHVANYSPDALDLTLIIVAVDNTGKAWALGYQHITLTAGRELNDVPFGSMLPQGQYIIRVDAVGEDGLNGRIFRSAVETPQSLAVVASP